MLFRSDPLPKKTSATPASALPLTAYPGPPDRRSLNPSLLRSPAGATEVPILAWPEPDGALVRSDTVVMGVPHPPAGGGPPMQAPPTQVSLVVQPLPSSHAVPLALGVTVHVEVPLHARVLHWSSVHVIEVPPHAPPVHASLYVQTLPSLHEAVLGAWTQPVPGLQKSLVQTFPSSH